MKRSPTNEKGKLNIKDGMVEHNSAWGIVADVILVIIMLCVIFVSIVPMWHTFMASISDGKALLGYKGVLWGPTGQANLDGYEMIFTSKQYLVARGYLNTIIYVLGSTALGLILNVIAGYVLSRKTKLKGPLMLFFLFTTMFSGGTVPTYLVLKFLGMTQTPLALIIPGCTNAMYIILCMNGFLQVPESTIEAAQLDGAKPLKIMFNVALPQALGLVLVTVINTIVSGWNSWYSALIYVPNQKQYWPLQLWIKEIVAQSENFMQSISPNYVKNTLQYVVIIISVLPLYILFPFFIKKLEQGMVLGAVKD